MEHLRRGRRSAGSSGVSGQEVTGWAAIGQPCIGGSGGIVDPARRDALCADSEQVPREMLADSLQAIGSKQKS
jgi:hypothetical protein